MRIFRKKDRDSYWKDRIEKTSRDRSSDPIPKVINAGEVIDQGGLSVQIMHNGLKVLAGGYHGQPMLEIIRNLKGHHEPQEEGVFYEILQRVPQDGTMIEVGSFWAYYSLWFSHGMPERKNYLIEPVLWKAALGRLNFALNNKPVNVDQYYMNDEKLDLDKSTGAELEALAGVEPICMDDYVRIKGIDHVDILHADIQGAELALLRGADSLLRDKRVDFVFLSTHKGRHRPCRQLLLDYEYQIINEHSLRKGSGYDGLLVASSPSAPAG